MISSVQCLDYRLKDMKVTMSMDDVIGTASKLRTGQPRKRRVITSKARGFSSLRSIQIHPASSSMGTGGFISSSIANGA